MEINNLEKLKKFISIFWSYNINEITLEKSLDDLGMYGDDKYDFIIAFSKEFDIDIKSINFNYYVEPEVSFLLYLNEFFNKLFNKKITNKFEVKTIKIFHLLDIIEKKYWIDI